jgi:hypothetical protein
MSLSFTDIPRFVDPEIYRESIARMVGRLHNIPGVVSVYQVGGINTPGISDIDLLVVFENGVRVEKNPVADLPAGDQYLFTHNLFGMPESFVSEVEQFTWFGKYTLLQGKEQNFNQHRLNDEEEKRIKKQLALEYLVKAFITSTVEHSYHTIKLRNLFLHAKALIIDLSFLEIESGKLADTIHEIMQTRNNWFHHPLSHKNLNYLAQQYHICLAEKLPELLEEEKFYLPANANLQISRNIRLKAAGKFSVSREGIFFPKQFMKVHPAFPKLVNKMNRFIFHLPAHHDAVPAILTRRYEFIREMVKYQKTYLPDFIPTAFGLNIFNEKVT